MSTDMTWDNVPLPMPKTTSGLFKGITTARRKRNNIFLLPHDLTLKKEETIGLDVEFIIRSKRTGLPVSMLGKIGGDKERPLKVKHGALQEDGVLAEINIDPVKDFNMFERNIISVLRNLQEVVERYNCYIDFNSICDNYPYSELTHWKALEAGCEPDFNCFTGEMNPPPIFKDSLRTCGGHIHLGIPNPTLKPTTRRSLAAFGDINISLPLKGVEPPNLRSTLYGALGSYRPKPYGVEIRAPSNYWIGRGYLRKFVYRQAVWTIRRANNKPLDNMLLSTIHDILHQSNGEKHDLIQSLGYKPIKKTKEIDLIELKQEREIRRNRAKVKTSTIKTIEEILDAKTYYATLHTTDTSHNG